MEVNVKEELYCFNMIYISNNKYNFNKNKIGLFLTNNYIDYVYYFTLFMKYGT